MPALRVRPAMRAAPVPHSAPSVPAVPSVTAVPSGPAVTAITAITAVRAVRPSGVVTEPCGQGQQVRVLLRQGGRAVADRVLGGEAACAQRPGEALLPGPAAEAG